MKNERFDDIISKELNPYRVDSDDPSANGFIKEIESNLAEVSKRHNLKESEQIRFLKYVKLSSHQIESEMRDLNELMQRIINKEWRI
jgi:hypothetical protein